MLGEVENWDATLAPVARAGYHALAPRLPIYDAPPGQTGVPGLADAVAGFLERVAGGPCVLVGNSLGGHVAIAVAHRYPQQVSRLVLSGASGLGEVALGTGTPRRFSRDFVRERTAFTFFDPAHATDALVDRMLALLADRARLTRLVAVARSARDTRVEAWLPLIACPTLLVWGRDDRITPPAVARSFARLLPDSRLVLLPRCGHAPMIEQPARFNRALLSFLEATAVHGV